MQIGTGIDITDIIIADLTIEITIDIIVGEVPVTITVIGEVEPITIQIGEGEIRIPKVVPLMITNMIIEKFMTCFDTF